MCECVNDSHTKFAYINYFLYLCAKLRNTTMKEEIIHKFESIFAKVIDTDQGNVELVPSPQVVQVPMAEGFGLHYAFHYAIRYKIDGNDHYLAFRYLQSDHLVSINDCRNWLWGVKRLGYNVRVCLVTDKGYEAEALEYVRNNSFDIDGRLILAKFCGDEEQTLVLNRLWTDYSDPRGRMGVLASANPCSGAVLCMNNESYNAIGILSELNIPIRQEYEFKCPYIEDEKIEEKALQILNAMQLTAEDLRKEPDYLWRIAERAKLKIEFMEMGDEFFGEYSYADKTIYLNYHHRLWGANVRERFTLAHELGHHFLHRRILEQYNYTTAEDQDTINVTGASNTQIRYFESQANKFASFLLMPGKVFADYAQEVMLSMNIRKGFVYDDNQYSQSEGAFNHRTALDFISKVADHFYVSKDAARYRLKNLGLLREQYNVDTPKLFF